MMQACPGIIRSRLPRGPAVRRLILSILPMLFAFVAPVHAFEAYGFHSGMSEDEAVRVARRYNAGIELEDIAAHRRLSHLLFDEYNSEGRVTTEWGLHFCDHTLRRLSKESEFSWPVLGDVIRWLNERYGHGSVRPFKLQVADLIYYGITLVWDGSEDSISVDVWQPMPDIAVVRQALRERRFGATGLLTEDYKVRKYSAKECIPPPVRERIEGKNKRSSK